MEQSKFVECERNRLQKIISFRLPHSFYSIGLIIAAISIIMMFVRAFAMDGDLELLKDILRKGLLIGLLFMSISRDKEEDELTIRLRMLSYTWGFVTGVVYAIIMPYVEYGVSNFVHSGGEALKDLGDFQVLLFMLMVQLMCYHVLKKNR